jgi:hypothetical protein
MRCVVLEADIYMRFMLHKFERGFDIFFHGYRKQRKVQDSNFSYNITEENKINF